MERCGTYSLERDRGCQLAPTCRGRMHQVRGSLEIASLLDCDDGSVVTEFA